MPFDALTYLTLGGENKSIEYEEVTVGPSPVVSVTDAAPLDAEDVVVSIEPVQAGSGDPSQDNVRPISGWTGAKVTRCGKNLLSLPFVFYSVVSVSKENCFFLPAGTYTVSFGNSTATSWRYVLRLIDLSGNEITDPTYYPAGISMPYRATVHGYSNGINSTTKQFSFTITSNCYVRILFWGGDTTSSSTFDNVQLELGSTTTDYEPYQGDTYDITFPSEAGTVYGGTLDVTMGVLTVDRAMVDLGMLTWISLLDNAAWNCFSTKVSTKANGGNNFICSNYPFAAIYTTETDGVICGNISNNNIYIRDSRYTDVAAFKTAMSGVQLVYELATPVTYTLTPQQIALLRGDNALWADTGDATLTYNAEVEIEDDSNNIIASHILRGKKLEDILMMQQLKISNSKT